MKRKILIPIAFLIILFFVLLFLKIDLTAEFGGFLKSELKSISGLEFTFEKITLKFIPLRLDIENAQFLEGERYFKVKKIKIYPSLSRILKGEIELRRITLTNSDFQLEEEFLDKTIRHIIKYFEKPLDVPIKVVVNAFEINNLSGKIQRDRDFLKFNNLYGRIFLQNQPSLSLVSNINASLGQFSNLDLNLKTEFSVKNNQIILTELKIFDINSLLRSQGKFEREKFLGEFLLSGKIFFSSLLKFFGIKGREHGHVNLDGKVHIAEGKEIWEKIVLDINFDGHFYLEDLMKILRVKEKLEGYTEIVKGKAYGSLSNLQASAKAKQYESIIMGVKIKKLETQVKFKEGILEFTSDDINLYSGKAKAHVWITIPVVKEHYVSVNLSKVSSKEIFEIIQWNPEIAEGVVDGILISQGNRFAPKGSFVYRRTGTGLTDLRGRVNQIKGEFYSDGDSYSFSFIEIKMPNTNTSASGKIDFKNKSIEFTFEGKSSKIRELLEPYSSAFDGEAIFKGTITGKTENPEVGLDIFSESVRVSLGEFNEIFKEENLNLNKVHGKLKYNKDKLRIIDLESSEQVALRGEINFAKAKRLFDFKEPTYSLFYSIKNIEFGNIKVSPFKEPIGLNLNLSGSISGKGKIEGDLWGFNFKIGNNVVIDSVSSSFNIENGEVYLNKGVIKSVRDKIAFNGKVDFDGNLNIVAHSDELNLKRFIEPYFNKIKAQNIQSLLIKNLKLDIKNNIKHPVMTLKGKYEVISKSNRNINGNLTVNYSNGEVKLVSSLLKSATFRIEGLLDRDHWEISGQFNSTRIDPILSIFSNNLPEDLVLVVDGAVEGTFDKKLNGRIGLNRLFTRLHGLGLSNKLPVNINIKNNHLYLEPITLIGQATELTIKGKVVDYYDILIEGQTDLRPAKALLKVDDLRGKASMLVYIYESINNPEVAGEIEVSNGALTIRKDFPNIHNINAIISFNEDRLLIEKASGTFSEGSVQIGGTVYLKDFSIERFGINGNLSNIRWIISPKSWAYIDGELYLKGNKSESKLNGNVNVRKGVFLERLDFAQLAIKSTNSKSSIPKDSWLSNLLLNVRIQAESFNLNNNLAEIPLKGDLLLKGTPSNPSLLGWISSDSGSIYFRGNRFELMRFLVQFNNPETIKPYLNISARTTVSQYNINLNINGYIDQFNLLLSSNPPLSENELLNILLIGQNGGSKGAISGISEASSFIAGQLQGVIEERVRGITGLDLMTIEPTISKSTGTISPKITIGKKLLDGKLSVTYSTATGTTAEHVMKIEYFIKKGISLVGLRDEIGGLSGAVKFRFEFH